MIATEEQTPPQSQTKAKGLCRCDAGCHPMMPEPAGPILDVKTVKASCPMPANAEDLLCDACRLAAVFPSLCHCENVLVAFSLMGLIQ